MGRARIFIILAIHLVRLRRVITIHDTDLEICYRDIYLSGQQGKLLLYVVPCRRPPSSKFVKNAGGNYIENPMKHVVCIASF